MKNHEAFKNEIEELKRNHVCNFISKNVLPFYDRKCDKNCVLCGLLSFAWLNTEYNEPETDWSKVEVDTPVLVREHKSDEWQRRYFCKFEYDKVWVWTWGKTSWTSQDDEIAAYKYAKLAEDGKDKDNENN